MHGDDAAAAIRAMRSKRGAAQRGGAPAAVGQQLNDMNAVLAREAAARQAQAGGVDGHFGADEMKFYKDIISGHVAVSRSNQPIKAPPVAARRDGRPRAVSKRPPDDSDDDSWLGESDDDAAAFQGVAAAFDTNAYHGTDPATQKTAPQKGAAPRAPQYRGPTSSDDEETVAAPKKPPARKAVAAKPAAQAKPKSYTSDWSGSSDDGAPTGFDDFNDGGFIDGGGYPSDDNLDGDTVMGLASKAPPIRRRTKAEPPRKDPRAAAAANAGLVDDSWVKDEYERRLNKALAENHQHDSAQPPPQQKTVPPRRVMPPKAEPASRSGPANPARALDIVPGQRLRVQPRGRRPRE
ncbi:hypothetical protein M885DRAFT_620726 [Pelagophyceae sp. CCMP2097]|nr:hypothetical protein M885DRAFT_620726 [Pelagophyceae sp. CCMP2097]